MATLKGKTQKRVGHLDYPLSFPFGLMCQACDLPVYLQCPNYMNACEYVAHTLTLKNICALPKSSRANSVKPDYMPTSS